MTTQQREAVLWSSAEDKTVRCGLCHFHCHIKDGDVGHCQVRRNEDGVLYSLNYHAICAVHVDPIEKKPLYHFQPGSRCFSLAAVGCNFRCDFCQNWQISQFPRLRQQVSGQSYRPEDLVNAALEQRCTSIAYTYTEPTIFMELAADSGRLAKTKGLANVFVSNGYMTPEAVDFAADWLDAINVDLKAFTEKFYHTYCKATLKGVMETLRYIARQTDIWLEVTTLIIPGANDGDDELKQLAGFIAEELGTHVPWHISRFHPDYEHTTAIATPPETLEKAYQIGRAAGLHYVYVGNLAGSGRENTICHACGQLLIERLGYRLGQINLQNGNCPNCGESMAGREAGKQGLSEI
ncbi:MAG: AmmeMemoRadiSam system radical SAM enzyme [Sedimentisphaerales bacterium]|nr:AmmeMemoRadiSam system radical SAM enzyme [Sedimentisphaerales bacterium]